MVKRDRYEPSSYNKGERLKHQTVNQLIRDAISATGGSIPAGMTGELGMLARLVSRMLFRRVTLTGDLNTEGSATAQPLEWQGSTNRYQADGGNEFDVYDGLGCSDEGDESVGQQAVDGQRGYAVYMADRGEWEMVNVPGLMLVTVAKDGGDDGDEDTNCTITYEVKTLGGQTLASRVTPEQGRYNACTYLPAGESGRSEYAIAAYVGTGASSGLKLLWVPGEYAYSGPC